MAVSLPSADQDSAKNHQNGTPNQIVITNPGKDYWHNTGDENNYPSVYIPDYNGNTHPLCG